MASCSIQGCSRAVEARKLCHNHYQQMWYLEGPFGKYSTQQIRQEIERRKQREYGGLSGLARQLAARYGTNALSERRMLLRITQGNKQILPATADRLETFFGVPCERLEREKRFG